MRRSIIWIFRIIFLCIFLYSAFRLGSNYLEKYYESKALSRLAAQVSAEQVSQAPSDSTAAGQRIPEASEGAEADAEEAVSADGQSSLILPELKNLHEQNSDLVGWLEIPGTDFSYPVMQTPDRPNYYLHRDFEGKQSIMGVPYAQEDCRLGLSEGDEESDNIIIHGHHIRGKRLFGYLEKYRDRQFQQEHPVIRLKTLYTERDYELISVFALDVSDARSFDYYRFIDAESAADFNSFVVRARKLSLYDTGVTASYGDKLLTLSTCDYSVDDGRLVVIARAKKN